MQIPLTQWTLHGENLPKRLLDEEKKPAFELPGAEALGAFADLIGEEMQNDESGMHEGVLYSCDGLFQADITGCVCLKREIDFGAIAGDYALLTFEHIAGHGSIFLGDREIARFGEDSRESLRRAYESTGIPCGCCVDLTEALESGRKETLELRFDDARQAGICGTAFLRVSSRAHLSRVSIQSDALRKTMTVRARISAHHPGRYVLRMQAIPGEKDAAFPDVRETDVTLCAGEEKGLQISMALDMPAFVPGQAYEAPAMKVQLFYRPEKTKGEGLLCDDALMLCGYASGAPKAWLALSAEDIQRDPDELCAQLCELGIYAVSLDVPAPDDVYRALCHAGIAAVGYVPEEIRPLFTRYPCLTLMDAPFAQESISLAEAAWQLAGSVSFPRSIDGNLAPDDMMDEVCGKRLDLDSPGVCDTLRWLRAVQIRLRAEAVRQGRYQGVICSLQEVQGDIGDALRTAFAPVHLSALPLSGAWWTGTRFSASLEAFVPCGVFKQGTVDALAVLEDEEGRELTRFHVSGCRGGYLGVIEYLLGDKPCVLTLSLSMMCGEDTIEESSIPVYIGERGPLEAAF